MLCIGYIYLFEIKKYPWALPRLGFFILSDKSQIIDLPTSQTNQQALVRFSNELAAKLKAVKVDLSGAEKLTWRDGTLYNGDVPLPKNIPKDATVLAVSSNVDIGDKYGGFLITVKNEVEQTSVHVDESFRDVENLKIEPNPDQKIGGIKVTQGASSVTFAGAIGTITSDGHLKISSKNDFTVGKIHVAGGGSYTSGVPEEDLIESSADQESKQKLWWVGGNKLNPDISYTGIKSHVLINKQDLLPSKVSMESADSTLNYHGINVLQPQSASKVTAYFNAKPPKFVLSDKDKGTGAVFVTKDPNTQNFNIESLGYAGFSVGEKDKPDYLSWVGKDQGNDVTAIRNSASKTQEITFRDSAETSNTVGEVGLGASTHVISKVNGKFGVASSVFGLASRIDYTTTFNLVNKDKQSQQFALFPSGTTTTGGAPKGIITTGGAPESGDTPRVAVSAVVPPAPIATIVTQSKSESSLNKKFPPLDPLSAAKERLHAVKRYVDNPSRGDKEKRGLLQELNKINDQMGAWIHAGGSEQESRRARYTELYENMNENHKRILKELGVTGPKDLTNYGISTNTPTIRTAKGIGEIAPTKKQQSNNPLFNQPSPHNKKSRPIVKRTQSTNRPHPSLPSSPLTNWQSDSTITQVSFNKGEKFVFRGSLIGKTNDEILVERLSSLEEGRRLKNDFDWVSDISKSRLSQSYALKYGITVGYKEQEKEDTTLIYFENKRPYKLPKNLARDFLDTLERKRNAK